MHRCQDEDVIPVSIKNMVLARKWCGKKEITAWFENATAFTERINWPFAMLETVARKHDIIGIAWYDAHILHRGNNDARTGGVWEFVRAIPFKTKCLETFFHLEIPAAHIYQFRPGRKMVCLEELRERLERIITMVKIHQSPPISSTDP